MKEHQSLVWHLLMVVVLQNLVEQNQDVHLTLVDVVLVVIFQEFFQLHQDELVWQVDVVRHHLY
jgi:hypothetical protein